MHLHHALACLTIMSVVSSCQLNECSSFLQRLRTWSEATVVSRPQIKSDQRPVFDPDMGAGLTFEEDKPRIDQFAQVLKNVPDAKGYIIAYGGEVGPVGEAKTRLKCIRDYLKQVDHIGPSRLVMIDGGYTSLINVELFLIKPGDPTPEATPTIKPSGVRIIKARRKGCR
jgi:hypothetical protein